MIASAIVARQMHTSVNIKITTMITMTNMKMKVDILAQKLVVSMDDDSSLADIGCISNPMNLLKSKSLTKVPTMTFGLTMLKLMSPLNWSR